MKRDKTVFAVKFATSAEPSPPPAFCFDLKSGRCLGCPDKRPDGQTFRLKIWGFGSPSAPFAPYPASLDVELSGNDAATTRRLDDVLRLTRHRPRPFVTIAATAERRLLTRSGVLRERGIHAGHGCRELQRDVDFRHTCPHGQHRVALARLQVDGLFHDLTFLEISCRNVAFSLHARRLLLGKQHQRAGCRSSKVRIDPLRRSACRTASLRRRRTTRRGHAWKRGELETSRSRSGWCWLCSGRCWLLRIWLLVATWWRLLWIWLLVATWRRLLPLRVLALRVLALWVLTLRVLTLRVLALWILTLLLVRVLRGLGVLRSVLLLATGRKRERAKQGGRYECDSRQSDLLGSRANPSHALCR